MGRARSRRPSQPARARLDVGVGIRFRRWLKALPRAAAIARQAALAAFGGAGRRQGLGPRGAEASVVLASDRFVRSLNLRYREVDAPTNVLAFAVLDIGALRPRKARSRGGCLGPPAGLGDVVVAFETAAAEAAAEGKPLADHLSHLVVHGMLHLLGYDHQTAAAAKAMERLEIKALSGLGVANPYTGGKRGRRR